MSGVSLRPAAALAALLPLLLGPGCAAPQYTLRTVRIGLVAPLSGPGQGEGYRWVFAARQAVRQWNETDGSHPYRVELVSYDEAEGSAVPRRLGVDPDLLGVVGHSRITAVQANLPHYREAGLVLLTPAPARNFGAGGPFESVLYLTPAAEAQAAAAVDRLVRPLRTAARAVVVTPADEEAARVADYLAQGASRVGGYESFEPLRLQVSTRAGYPEVSEQLARAGPNVVLFVGPSVEASEIGSLIPPGSASAPLVLWPTDGRPVRLAPDGPLSPVLWLSPAGPVEATSAGAAFAETYRRLWNEVPSPLTGVVYDGVNLLLEAVGAAALAGRPHAPREAVTSYLRTRAPYQGIMREYAFRTWGELLDRRGFLFRLDAGSGEWVPDTELAAR